MLAEPAAVVIKHNNPCGAAMDAQLATAMRNAWDGDPVSAFGSVLGLNRVMDAATAEVLAETDRFVEAIIAPGFSDEAFQILTTKPKWKANVRLVEIGTSAAVAPQALPNQLSLRQIDGGCLPRPATMRVINTATGRSQPLSNQRRNNWPISSSLGAWFAM